MNISTEYERSMTEMSGTIINLEDVSVHFQKVTDRPRTMKEFFIRSIKQGVEARYTMALEGVSLKIHRGEVFGVIGRNGAGKSTLLRVMSGIIIPTHGRVRIWGKIAPLLGIGAGFNGELTGRENVHIYSSILGRTNQETHELFDGIVDFAELSDFIDTPLRMYSSGMVARLGFAVAMAKRPEILLVDEVLGVGDEQFREKCLERFAEFQGKGTTVVLVTHNIQAVGSTCSRVLWLHDGRVEALGDPEQVVAEFRIRRQLAKQTTSIRGAVP